MTPIQLRLLQCFLPDLFCNGLGQGGMFSDSGSASTGENKERIETLITAWYFKDMN